MRLAHITDLHVERTPDASDVFNKRLFGVVNLYLLGRSGHFSRAVQDALPGAVLAARPDRVVCTGDLTATATDAEFEAARQLLAGLGDMPFDVIPGNHDVYTAESAGRFSRYFGTTETRRVNAGPVDLCLFDVCGAAPPGLAETLRQSDRPAILCIHYPLRGRRGLPYGPSGRALVGADAVEALIEGSPQVVGVLHGHEHHGFRTTVGARQVPIYNPGASGYAHLPKKHRTAHFNVYDVDATGIRAVERYAWNGEAFVAEPGGAYATGG